MEALEAVTLQGKQGR